MAMIAVRLAVPMLGREKEEEGISPDFGDVVILVLVGWLGEELNRG